MPLDDSFRLTQLTIDFVDGPRSRARLMVDPDDVLGRGIDAYFLNVQSVVDMTDATVTLWWQHDQAPALRGLEPFEAVDAGVGHFKVYYPSAMGQSAGTITAKIMVQEDGATIAVPLPGIEVPGDRADPSATPSEDTFSVLAKLLELLEDGIVDVGDATRAANEAAERADDAAEVAIAATADATAAAGEARSAAGAANDAADAANAAADRVDDSISKAEAAAERAETGEDARELAERGRVEAEEARESAEGERESAETSRAGAESGRVEAELARAKAESARDEAETARSDAEDARAEAELRRVQAEQGRVDAEDERVEAEELRVAAEELRVAAENERDAAETGRESAESARVEAEADRARRFEESQSERDAAFRESEAGRDAQVQGAVKNAEAATDEANRAASDADEYIEGLRASVEAGEFDGATFTPSVSAEGELSWTNDRSLPNPQAVNVKGPKGDKGDTGAGLNVLDSYATYGEMVGEHPEGSAVGEAYMVGTHYWVWNGGEWTDCGELRGAKGDPGTPAGWGDVTATVDDSTGTPKVEVTATGPDTAKAIRFAFTGIKGPQGDQGPAGTSVTHEWDGSTLRVTSASGTSSADLMGPRGPAGENATTTELASEAAPGLLRQLSGKEDQVLLGTGEWGEYRGGGGSAGPLWLEVDDAGDLYAYYDDGSGAPNLDYDDESGDLYAIFETEA